MKRQRRHRRGDTILEAESRMLATSTSADSSPPTSFVAPVELGDGNGCSSDYSAASLAHIRCERKSYSLRPVMSALGGAV